MGFKVRREEGNFRAEFIPRRGDCRACSRFRRFAGKGIEENRLDERNRTVFTIGSFFRPRIHKREGWNVENWEEIYTCDLHASLRNASLLLANRLSICLKISLIRYIYMYIRIIRKGKGNFKGNNRSIGFDLFEYRLRVKKWSNSPPLLPLYFIIKTDLSRIKFYTLYLQNDFIIYIIFSNPVL